MKTWLCLSGVFVLLFSPGLFATPYWEISPGIDGPNTCRVGETINITIYGTAAESTAALPMGCSGYLYISNSVYGDLNPVGIINPNAGGAATYSYYKIIYGEGRTFENIPFRAAPAIPLGTADVLPGEWFIFSFTGRSPGNQNISLGESNAGGGWDYSTTFSVIPEPSTTLCLILGSVLGLKRRNH